MYSDCAVFARSFPPLNAAIILIIEKMKDKDVTSKLATFAVRAKRFMDKLLGNSWTQRRLTHPLQRMAVPSLLSAVPLPLLETSRGRLRRPRLGRRRIQKQPPLWRSVVSPCPSIISC